MVLPDANTVTTLAVGIQSPVLIPPENSREGVVDVPAGMVKLPDSVPPVNGKFNEAKPVKVALIVPAVKFPDASRATIALAVFALVAVVAELATRPAVAKVASLEFEMFAELEISVSTIRDDDKTPEALL